jgi:hypothetical protein
LFRTVCSLLPGTIDAERPLEQAMTVSRRDFLKLSSLATGGGALGGLSALGASLAPARSA